MNWWLRPDMTETIVGMLSLSATNQTCTKIVQRVVFCNHADDRFDTFIAFKCLETLDGYHEHTGRRLNV